MFAKHFPRGLTEKSNDRRERKSFDSFMPNYRRRKKFEGTARAVPIRSVVRKTSATGTADFLRVPFSKKDKNRQIQRKRKGVERSARTTIEGGTRLRKGGNPRENKYK